MIRDTYYFLKYILQKDKDKCPKCGETPFLHGVYPDDDMYCTNCGFWEPDWEEWDKFIEEMNKK